MTDPVQHQMDTCSKMTQGLRKSARCVDDDLRSVRIWHCAPHNLCHLAFNNSRCGPSREPTLICVAQAVGSLLERSKFTRLLGCKTDFKLHRAFSSWNSVCPTCLRLVSERRFQTCSQAYLHILSTHMQAMTTKISGESLVHSSQKAAQDGLPLDVLDGLLLAS